MGKTSSSTSLSTSVEVPVRLRRAINLNDLVLVKRIVKNNPVRLQNPDSDGNTSLHLAAKLGFLEIAIMLAARTAPSPPSISTASPTFPAEQQTPAFPQLLLSTLLHLSPIPTPTVLTAVDNDGNTALHYASAYGQLKAIRALLAAGANPGAKNKYSWTPVAYSSTVQAEVYFKGLIGGGNESVGGGGSGGGALRREGEIGGLSRNGGGAGLRIVRTGEEMGSGAEMRGGDGRRRAGSAQ
ncbi:MAG: hypothetical protein Q9166_007766 [cf. Caloplaca sp. 2 TL-2023]